MENILLTSNKRFIKIFLLILFSMINGCATMPKYHYEFSSYSDDQLIRAFYLVEAQLESLKNYPEPEEPHTYYPSPALGFTYGFLKGWKHAEIEKYLHLRAEILAELYKRGIKIR